MRPAVLTPAKRALVVEMVSTGASRNQAARTLGCAASTITYATYRDPGFRAELLRAQAAHQRRLARQALAARHFRPTRPSCQPSPACAPQRAAPRCARQAGQPAAAPASPRDLVTSTHPAPLASPRPENIGPKRQRGTPATADPPAASRLPPRSVSWLAEQIAADFEDLLEAPELFTHSLSRLSITGGK
jgi:hypothetical protein